MAGEAENNRAVKLTKQVRQLAASGCYSKAFDLYITAFEKFPVLKSRLEVEFRFTLKKLNEGLISESKVSDIFFNFERAHDIFPGNKYILNDIGQCLYKFGYYKEACTHFHKALLLDPGYVAAEKNFNSVKNFFVERWHFRMLNDKIRNEAYRSAIHEILKPHKDSVLDLGCGTGILSIYCSECQPVRVTAVDSSETMTDIATAVLAENGVNQVALVTKPSTTLTYRDIGGKRTLLVNEIFDAGLFGEHILETLLHAWEFLVAKIGRILPAKAEFYVAGIKCDFLHLKYHLSSSAKTILNIKNQIVHVLSDSYDCDDLHLINTVDYITEPSSLLKVDFNDVESIESILNKDEPYEVKLKAKKSGEINVIAGWFDLHLSSNVMITTNPMSKCKSLAWQQAIFFDLLPTSVTKNNNVSFKFTSSGGKLALVSDSSLNMKKISAEMMRFLNDEVYTKMIMRTVSAVCIYLLQMTPMSELDMVDLCPFPLFGLLMMKRGAASLICYAHCREDKKFIRNVFNENKIPPEKVTILVGGELVKDVFIDLNFHIVFSNILNVAGDLDVQHKDVALHLRNSHLVHGGLMLPFSVSLEAQIIRSDWLNRINRVSDDNVSGYKLGEIINVFQVSQNIHLDISMLEFTALTNPVTVGIVSKGMRPMVFNVPIIEDGYANAVLCWYTIQLIENGETISTNRASSFIDNMAFLAHPLIPMRRGNIANILRCVDSDGMFKLIIDTEH